MTNNTGMNKNIHNNFTANIRNKLVNFINKEFAMKATDELISVTIEALLGGDGKRMSRKTFSWHRNDNVTLGDKVADICEQYIINNIGQPTDIHCLVVYGFTGSIQIGFDRRFVEKDTINIWKNKFDFETL